MIENYYLSLILLIPLLGAFAVQLIPKENSTAVKVAGIAFSSLAFLVSVWVFVQFDGANAGMQFVEKVPWISSLDVSYHLGIDGISLLLVVLTTFLTPIAL